MLERLLDIAVYALLAALIAAGAARMLDQRRETQTIAWTEAVTRAMERLAGLSTGYAPPASQGTDMAAALAGSGLLPAAMIDRASDPVLRNGFGGTIQVVALPASFTVTQDALPPAACVALAARARDWAQQICLNGNRCIVATAADPAWTSAGCTRTSGELNTIMIEIVP
jgi:PilS N terminal